MMLTVISLIFGLGVMIGMPIAFSMGLAGASWILFAEGIDPTLLTRRSLNALSSFPLLAIPLFIMVGSLAERCGMLPDLIRWLQLVFGWVRGGRAYINVAGSMLFAGVSGTAVSDIASLGRIEIKMMTEAGYPRPYAAALTAVSSILAPIIPPSVAMVIYALAAGNVSIGGLFMAGLVPGVTLGLGLMAMSWYKARYAAYGTLTEFPKLGELVHQTTRVIPLLILPVVIVGGIVSGVMTVTESAAVGVVYVLFVGSVVTGQLRVRDVYESIIYSAVVSSVLGMLIAAGAIVSWILTRNQITQQLADFMSSVTTDPTVFMAVVAIGLFFIGMVMDATAIIIALAPILAPIARQYGVPDLQFGVLFVITCMIGLITPPVGIILFMTSTVAEISFEALARAIWPFVIWCVALVALIILLPGLTLWVPRYFGF